MFLRNEILNRSKVANIFITATVSALRSLQHKEATFIPETRDFFYESEKQIEEADRQYSQIAKEFMRSYKSLAEDNNNIYR